jgi:CubicO group peptidase (beta-lactamase class C family)
MAHLPINRRQLIALSAGAAGLAIQETGVKPAMSAQPATPSAAALDADAAFLALTDTLEQAMLDRGIAGAAAGVYHNGTMTSAVFGFADLESQTLVTTDTRFGIGSVSKTYTSTAVMRLVELGELDLDGLVRTYIPGLRLLDEEVAANLTVRNLLTHTGGWYGDLFVQTGAEDDALVRFVDGFLPTFPQIFPLGRYYSYNNAGYVLLGYLIEVVAGKPYRAAMQELVLDPLGLEFATFDPDMVEAGPHASGYVGGTTPDTLNLPLFMPRNLDSTGGLWTTIDNQLRYAAFHLGDGSLNGEPYISADLLALMKEPQMPFPESPGISMGMNWAITEASGKKLALHSGQTFSQNATLILVPEEHFAVAVLANADSSAAVLTSIASSALASYLGITDPIGGVGSDGGHTLTAVEDAVEDLDAATFVGIYETPQQTVTIREAGNGLVLDFEYHVHVEDVLPDHFEAPGGRDIPLTFTEPDRAVLGEPSAPAGAAVFLRNDDGDVEWIAFAARIHRRIR